MMIIDMLNGVGWDAFTLPRGQKFPPPAGWTGLNKSVSDGMRFEEIEKEESGKVNVGLSLPDGVVGIDIDSLDTDEAKEIREATKYSWRLSSNDGTERYTALYNLPDGIESSDLKNIPGVDLITSTHRYTIAHGTHPSGRTYQLYSPACLVSIHELPEPDELEVLPERVIELMKRTESRRNPSGGAEHPEGYDYSQHTGTPCKTAYRAFERGMRGFGKDSDSKQLLKVSTMLAEIQKQGHNIGSLPNSLIDSYSTLRGEEKRGSAEKACKVIGFPEVSTCLCADGRDNYYIDRNLLSACGMERSDIEAEVFIREQGYVFPTDNHRRKFRESTAFNLLRDINNKTMNRERAEEAYASTVLQPSTMRENTNLMERVSKIAKTEREAQVSFLVGYGYTDIEAAEVLEVSRSTVKRTKATIRERGQNVRE